MPLNLRRRMHKGLRRLTRPWDAARPAAVILIYHRVTAGFEDPQQLAVSPQHFAQQLQVIQARFQPLSVRELVDALKRRDIPRRGVAITFDDGYRDNLVHALPLLQQAGAPATIFATSTYLGGDREFWWDDVERVLLRSAALPDSLELTSSQGAFQAFTRTDEDRMSTYARILPWMRRHGAAEIESIRAHLANWAGIGRPGRPSHAILTHAELRTLAADPLIEIGAHTREHVSLAHVTPAEQWDEILGSKQDLESILGKEVAGFSFPFGTRTDYTAETIDLVRQAGFQYAIANFPDRVTARSDAWQLPRHVVRNWSGEEFERQLERFFRPPV